LPGVISQLPLKAEAFAEPWRVLRGGNELLFEHYGVPPWVLEAGRPIDPANGTPRHDLLDHGDGVEIAETGDSAEVITSRD
jgi:hypothetical protein